AEQQECDHDHQYAERHRKDAARHHAEGKQLGLPGIAVRAVAEQAGQAQIVEDEGHDQQRDARQHGFSPGKTSVRSCKERARAASRDVAYAFPSVADCREFGVAASMAAIQSSNASRTRRFRIFTSCTVRWTMRRSFFPKGERRFRADTFALTGQNPCRMVRAY